MKRIPRHVLSLALAVPALACGGDNDPDATSDGSSDGSSDDGASVDGSATAPSTAPSTMSDGDDSSSDDDGDSSDDGSDDDASSSSSDSGEATLVISGHVLGYMGLPSVGAEVTIEGTTVTTDDDGAFAFAGVTAPYDVLVELPDNGTVTYVRGLTREDPSVHTWHFEVDYNEVAVDGQLSGGGGFPQGADHSFAVGFDSALVHDEVSSNQVGGDGDYDLLPRWYGPNYQDGSLLALQWHSTIDGQPTGYDGIATAELGISNGGSFLDQDLALAPVTDAMIGGNITLPEGTTFALLELFVGTGERASVRVGNIEDPPSEYTFVVPEADDVWTATTLIAANDAAVVYSFRTAIAPGTDDVDLDVPALPSWTAPAVGTMLAADTTLQWDGLPDATSLVLLWCPDADYSLTIVTDASETTIPALPELGTLLVPGAECVITLEQYAPNATIDAWAGAQSPTANRDRVWQSYPSAALFDGAFAQLENLPFTVAP